MQRKRSGVSTTAIASATLVIALITAAGVFTMYTGVAPVAKVTLTATSVSTATSVTTLPAQVLTSTTTLPGETATLTSITTLPAQVVSVTQTTTTTTTHTTATITTTTVTDTSQVASLQAFLNLSNKSQLFSNLKLKAQAGTPCTNYPGCINANSTIIFTFTAAYAGYVLISGTSNIQCCGVYLFVQNGYSSLANSVGCGVNVDCSYGFYTLTPTSSQRSTVVAVLPGTVTFTLINQTNQTGTVTISAWYWS